jgi:hypothetical protein
MQLYFASQILINNEETVNKRMQVRAMKNTKSETKDCSKPESRYGSLNDHFVIAFVKDK